VPGLRGAAHHHCRRALLPLRRDAAPFHRNVPGKLGNAALAHGLRTFRITLGGFYVAAMGISLALIANTGWMAVLLAIFGLPCCALTRDQSQRRTRLGNPMTWEEFFLALLENLAWPAAGFLIFLALAFTCAATVGF
jgi:Flp pilus assembly protein TadB